jgi:hypothetical protein
MKAHLKRIFGPPAIVALCWGLYTYGDFVQFFNQMWDYLTVFCFSALLFGFFALPFVVGLSALSWWRAPHGEKGIACSYFIGWALSWSLLLLGGWLLPRGNGWP